MSTTNKFLKKRKFFHIFFTSLVTMSSVVLSTNSLAEYKLPFPEGKSYTISQCGSGYNGANQFNHTGDMEYAWDFAMNQGETIVAISSGKVIHVTQNYPQGYCNKNLENKGNRVVIKHEDDSYSLYLHLLKNSVIVSVGDNVKQGQPIGKSGASGYVCSLSGGDGAHLHFQLQEKPPTYWAPSKYISFAEENTCKTGKIATSTNNYPASNCAGFSDVSSSNKYCKSIKYAKEHKIMNGYGNGYFYSGDQLINRAEFIKLVLSARNTPLQSLPSCFSDLESSTAWYTPYICTAKKKGIVKGDNGGGQTTFRPSKHINYVEALKIALKAYGYEGIEADGNWYDTYLAKAKKEGIATLSPSENVGRDFAAHLLCQINEKILLGNNGGKCSE